VKNKGLRFLASLVLLGVLAVPIALQAQDRDDQNRDNHDRDRKERVYDREHKDYHNWDANEDRRYRSWWEENHHGQAFRDYKGLDRRDQQSYWNWRHAHQDNDDRDRH
jgi:Ni/Co efflux regulator RcnB